jgi:CxxC-x17-CxxC domain-containing protein
MAFVDRDLTCADCGATFVFSAGEQQFFNDKGFRHDPKRCKQCKAKQDHTRTRVETRVNCAGCGRDTTVPFKPTGSRPVLCADCFKSAKVVPIRSE